jgi:hypothetical protein
MKKQLRALLAQIIKKHYGLPDLSRFRKPENITLVDVRTLDGLAKHEVAWNELFLKADRPSPLLSYAWTRAFFQHVVAAPEKWICLFVYENGRLAGVLPLVAGYSYRALNISLQLYKLPYHFAHTSGTDALTLPGQENLWQVFWNYLNSIPNIFPFLSLKHIPEHYASARFAAGRHPGICIIRKPADFEACISTNQTGRDFLQQLSPKFRQNLARAAREFEKLPNGRFLFCDSDRSADENTDRFLDVEDKGWKGRNRSSMKHYPSSAAAFRTAAEGLAAQGLMGFSFLESDGQTIAAHYAMRNADTLYILKMGYDEEFESCSPGNLLMLKVIQAACDSGAFREINFVSNPPLLEKWNVERKALHHFIFMPKIPLLSNLVRKIIESGKIHSFDIER